MSSCPKDVVVPVIFIPGIMGSPLQTAKGEIVWAPDDKILMGKKYIWNSGSVIGPDLFRLRERENVSDAAQQRKKLLIGGNAFDKDYLKPVEYAAHDDLVAVSSDFWGSQVERNWGSVAWGFYGGILKQLEHSRLEISQQAKQSNPLFNLVEMPVFALGYNWSQSNYDSGKYAAEKIKEWVSRGKARADEIGAQCPGAVVVTHSMGGLVARSATKIHGAEDDVFAVIHTAMPTDGAAAAYKRFHFGFEHPKSVLSMETVTYLALGRQGALVTAILGHMPGGQELLPNKRYRDNAGNSKWLAVQNPERNMIGRWVSGDAPYIELPSSNPYTEIYRREDRMYRAANPEWLFPEGMEAASPKKSAFSYFAEQNRNAESLHDKLISNGDFHEITYICYSDDSSLKTYDRIDWESDKPLGALGRSINDDDVSEDRTHDYRREHLRTGDEADKEVSGGWFGTDYKIDLGSGAGDGTVPTSSGAFANVAPSRKKAHTSGYTHDAATDALSVQSWVKETIGSLLGQCSLY
ncbi:esterase/lipase family protein [Celeribacter ethanolicus]|uniref:esterase/lipase family protein n=1 Tax=Celeribacter ethanolicus TaxID=1758178 RepID=UPI0008316A34|nr:hypothetical protein [Celeribacter ethanolicus]